MGGLLTPSPPEQASSQALMRNDEVDEQESGRSVLLLQDATSESVNSETDRHAVGLRVSAHMLDGRLNRPISAHSRGSAPVRPKSIAMSIRKLTSKAAVEISVQDV